MLSRRWNGFLAAAVWAGLLTGCAADAPQSFDVTDTPALVALVNAAQIAATHGDTHALVGLTDATPATQQPYWAALDQLTGKTGPLLVVITYGNGCSATSAGNGLRDVADAIRSKYPKLHVITRGFDDRDGIADTLERHRGPIALIGHSFGGCRSVELGASLHRPVDHLILLDPVPCEDWAVRREGRYFQVPALVRDAVCYYRPARAWPISYPLLAPLKAGDNRLRSLPHSAFCRDAEVRQYILDVCASEAARQ